ncbi:ribonuclease P protein subunit p21-like, partial [Scyliorhinus torazame]|uniref:ribonuclease P protein subunit p21-like n=1 Tax=Scyliorhinus torazame TaxID=75743 RepID=UPI003B5C1E02
IGPSIDNCLSFLPLRDPSVKRTICKCCSSLLLPGLTATVRHRKRGQRVTIVRCLTCGLTKRFPRQPGYSLWTERPEAQLQTPTPHAAQLPAETDQSSQTSVDLEDGRKESDNQ